jgi:ribosomal protein L37AE/L43A
MATVASLRGSAHEVICDKCSNSLIAPEWSEYFSEAHLVLNLWSCANCGNRFETEAFAPVDAESKIDSEVLEEFFPSLLVA